jgi:EAL domain-containing protein (putative c-di-GMP-specific phosphodiesterase class I)
MSYLKRLPIHAIEVDRSFVKPPADANDAMMNATVELGRTSASGRRRGVEDPAMAAPGGSL